MRRSNVNIESLDVSYNSMRLFIFENPIFSEGRCAPSPRWAAKGQCACRHTSPPELELELIQTHKTQKPMPRVEVGAVSTSRCACVALKGHARENRGAWASAACKALGCDHEIASVRMAQQSWWQMPCG